jgi:hypothetical protein
MSGKRRVFVGGVVSLALLVAPGAASAAIVTNGDFETGNFSGWHEDYVDAGAGHWFNYTGTFSPISASPIPAPPQGTHAAITDQADESRQILYQDVTLPPGGSVNQLSLFAYYREGPFASPDTLSLDVPNEQYRIDVMKPSAPIDSVSPGDVLINLLRTTPSSPNTLDPTQLTADLSPYAGQTVRIRFAVPVTQHVLTGGVDAVSVKSNGFSLSQAKFNKKKGTATVPVTVPDDGTLKVSGKGVSSQATLASKSVAVSAGTVRLLIKPNKKTKGKLNDRGKAKVKVSITYKPTGLTANVEKTKLKLKKKT